MPANPRLVRARADQIFGAPPTRTKHQQQIYDRIMLAAPTLLAEFGPIQITFAILAIGLRISTTTLRRHFVDIDDLLGTILLEHLGDVEDSISVIPDTAPDPPHLRRQAYLAATRGQNNRLKAAHALLVQARHTLPPDLLDRIEHQRQRIGQALVESPAGARADQTLLLLDNPAFSGSTIEAMLAAHAAAHPPPPKPRCPTALALAWHNAASPGMHEVGDVTDTAKIPPDVALWQSPPPAPRATPPPPP